MAEASKTVEMPVPMEKLWGVINKFEDYPQFVEGVKSVKVLSRDGGKARVQFGVQLLGKDINYTLDHTESGKGNISWKLVESNVFKSNEGSWSLRDLGGGRTEVTYRLSLDFKIFVPGMILNGLVKSSLPKMLEQFQGRAGS